MTFVRALPEFRASTVNTGIICTLFPTPERQLSTIKNKIPHQIPFFLMIG